ncbi:MAG: glycosyltransferase [Candidatus Omnitrophica bacterium]|nr:glycosyltransferase [Candidatus Omnitrophota bacterium]
MNSVSFKQNPSAGISAVPASFHSCASKRISFILTTKNKAAYLDKAFDRLGKIIKAEDELIIIDGLSNDDTSKIIEKHAALIGVYISEKDKTASHAFNKGILLAQGKYIRQVTDDDEVHSEGLEKAVAVLEKHPEIDLLLCGGTKQEKQKVWNYCVPPGAGYGRSTEDPFKYQGACGAGFIIRRSSIAWTGLHPNGICGDQEFVLECIRRGATVRFCRINLYHHPIYEHSTIHQLNKRYWKEWYRLAKQYCSPSFYYDYRIRSFGLKLSEMFHVLLQRLGMSDLSEKKFSGNAASETNDANDAIWDGGFS